MFRRGGFFIEVLYAEVRKNMESKLKGAAHNRIKSRVIIDSLIKANDINVPAALLEGKINLSRQ